jgi:dihydrofolate reductase
LITIRLLTLALEEDAMAMVVADMSMSLDGFVAGPNHDVDEVFSWITAGDVTVESANPDLVYKVDEASVEEVQESDVKALVIGRRTFDLAGGWGGTHPVGVPVWIPTHDPPTVGTTPRSPSSPKASRRRSARRASARATGPSGSPARASPGSA